MTSSSRPFARPHVTPLGRVVAAVLLSCAVLASGGAQAAADSPTYLAHAPARAAAHPPLIVLLHGSGADERDMIGLWRDLPPDFVVVSPRAPFADEGGGLRWYRKAGAKPRADDLATARKLVDRVVDDAVARFGADAADVFVAGFSQGAVMVYDIALHEPGRFRGAAVLSGTLFAGDIAALSTGADPAAFKRTPFFIAHGAMDRRIAVGSAKAARRALASFGMPIAFHVYPTLGHGTDAAEIRDLADWLKDLRTEKGAPDRR